MQRGEVSTAWYNRACACVQPRCVGILGDTGTSPPVESSLFKEGVRLKFTGVCVVPKAVVCVWVVRAQ